MGTSCWVLALPMSMPEARPISVTTLMTGMQERAALWALRERASGVPAGCSHRLAGVAEAAEVKRKTGG